MTENEHKQHSYDHEQHHDRHNEIAEKQTEAIRDKLEKDEQSHIERISEQQALQEAQDLASKHEQADPPQVSPAEKRRGPISKKQLSNSFNSQMNHAQSQMNGGSRAFSKLLHSRPVEAVSEAASSTVARPNALLSGSICAFIAITVLYFVAKHYGFPLSGFETIAAFIFGWIVGILYDYFSVMIRGKKS
jgi:hypothetical protein